MEWPKTDSNGGFLVGESDYRSFGSYKLSGLALSVNVI
jgi:hypothetical protein